jgi:hypothetical protein
LKSSSSNTAWAANAGNEKTAKNHMIPTKPILIINSRIMNLIRAQIRRLDALPPQDRHNQPIDPAGVYTRVHVIRFKLSEPHLRLRGRSSPCIRTPPGTSKNRSAHNKQKQNNCGDFPGSGFKTAFVARTSEIFSHKAEVQNRRRRSQNYVEDEFCADNAARGNCSRS